MVVTEDETVENYNVGSLGPSQETTVRSGIKSVMSWDIELEIVHSSKIG